MTMKRKFPVSGKWASSSWAVIGAALACIVIPASAQVPPADRGTSESKAAPHYVDSADYDRQPYYVDGVQYKPYVPDKKAKTPAATPAAPATTPPVTELHPFAPSDTTAASASAAPKVAQAASASSSSAETYIPKKRPRYAMAIIEAVDKVTAESVRFEAPIGQPVRYKGLIYMVKACETTADDEAQPDVIAYMQVRTNPTGATNTAAPTHSKEIFHGWTYASTPSLNPIQHPVYDAWVIACRQPLQVQPTKAG